MSKERLATEGRSRLFWRACSQVLSLCAELYYQVPFLMHGRRGPPPPVCVFRKVTVRSMNGNSEYSSDVRFFINEENSANSPSERINSNSLPASFPFPKPLESVFKTNKQIAALTYQLLPSFLPSFLPSTRAPKSVPRISHPLLHTAISISNKTTSHLHRSTPQQTTLVKNTDVSIYQLQYVKAPPCVFRRGGGDG